MTTKRMKSTQVNESLTILSPLEEHQYIAKRIEELFAIFDRFKVQLHEQQGVNEGLVKNVLE